ncbi:MAG: pirin family protein [Pseudomonadota bacterium]
MIQIYKYDDLGHVQSEWLNAHHHFSFGHYMNPSRMGFGPLRVINDDEIKAGSGFGLHPHRDMEIITYVRQGTIIHKDSMDNTGKTQAGDVQVLSAGKGVAHSEYADSKAGENTKIYQIWIEPRAKGLEPAWGQAEFPRNSVGNHLNLLVSGRPEDADKGALVIQQDAAIFGGRLDKGAELTQALRGKNAYVLVSKGAVSLDGQSMSEGDGAEITDQASVTITAASDSEVLIIEL